MAPDCRHGLREIGISLPGEFAKVRIDQVSDEGIRYSIRYHLIPREVSIHKARHTLNESVLRHLRQEGIGLAYPKRQIIDPTPHASKSEGVA